MLDVQKDWTWKPKVKLDGNQKKNLKHTQIFT